MENIKIKRLKEAAVLPKRATEGSAGYDLSACLDAPVCISPGQTMRIPTGISIELPKGTAGFVFARSSVATKFGVAPANCVGVIDSDYRGEVIVALRNSSHVIYNIEHGNRIAQLVIIPVLTPEIVETDLSETGRGEGGFGSTGK